MSTNRQISLAMLIGGASGGHPASWLHPKANAAGSTDVAYYRSLAQTAERGLFDLFFIADTPAARTDNLHAWSRFPMFMNVLEPVTLLTALLTDLQALRAKTPCFVHLTATVMDYA